MAKTGPKPKPMNVLPDDKAAARARIATDLKAFLAGGGRIEVLPGFTGKVDRHGSAPMNSAAPLAKP